MAVSNNRKVTRRPFNPDDLKAAKDGYMRNRIVFDWLADDTDRNAFYTYVNDPKNKQTSPFAIFSRAKFNNDPAPLKDDHSDSVGSTVYLVTKREHIQKVFSDTVNFSNLPYSDIGSGAFMLGLDPSGDPDLHQRQRTALKEAMAHGPGSDVWIQKLSVLAVREAKVISLRLRNFDMADFSEAAGIRFCLKFFGFATSDYALLEDALRKAYHSMCYQMMARHFTTEPLTTPVAREAMAKLGTRISHLIDEYQHLSRYPRWDERKGDPRASHRLLPEGVEPLSDYGLAGFKTVIEALSLDTPANSVLTGQERAVIVVGTLAGLLGNIQAGSSIGIEHLLNELAHTGSASGQLPVSFTHDAKKGLWAYISEGINKNPPAPYLPRIVSGENVTLGSVSLPKGTEFILMIGGGTTERISSGCPMHHKEDPLMFGFVADEYLGDNDKSQHWCVGDYLARPLIEEIVRQTLLLPGLARRLDSVTAEPLKLEKQWGYMCRTLPLTYKREKLRAQQTLNVTMKVKAPIAEHAERLKRIIKDGAPRIERALTLARHVHFAWFEMIENDTKLVLHTVYDGDFEAYVDHFALTVDDMFDLLFQSIEGAPPLPVRDYPHEFVDAIRRYNLSPVGAYVFSAYPTIETHRITAAAEKGIL